MLFEENLLIAAAVINAAEIDDTKGRWYSILS